MVLNLNNLNLNNFFTSKDLNDLKLLPIKKRGFLRRAIGLPTAKITEFNDTSCVIYKCKSLVRCASKQKQIFFSTINIFNV